MTVETAACWVIAFGAGFLLRAVLADREEGRLLKENSRLWWRWLRAAEAYHDLRRQLHDEADWWKRGEETP